MCAPSKASMSNPNVFQSIFDLIDAVVEFYLKQVIKPFLAFHERFYSALNKTLRQVLDDNQQKVPEWFTANFITYLRTVFVIPTILLLAWKHALLPALIVVLVDFGDFLDGVVARFWVDIKKKRETLLESKDKKSASPVSSDDESYEVITTGSPHVVPSWVNLHRSRTYGGFIDAVCDKAFVVPCWICLLHTVPHTSYCRILQYIVFFCLILAEISSGCIRFKAYFTSGGHGAPKVEGLDFSTSAVKADHIGKAKQTFEMVGTAMYVVGVTRYFGLFFLSLAVPLAYESVRRKVKRRVIYVHGTVHPTFNYKTLKFWMQAKAMGSKLIVGVPGKTTDFVLNACASTSVDTVIAEAPTKIDMMFLQKQGIDFCLMKASQAKFFTDEVAGTQRVLAVGEDGVARPLSTKGAVHQE